MWLIAAQLCPIVTMIELLVVHSLWTAPFSAAAIFGLGRLERRHCGLPLWDKRVMGTRLPVRPNVIDKCPQCGIPMFSE